MLQPKNAFFPTFVPKRVFLGMILPCPCGEAAAVGQIEHLLV